MADRGRSDGDLVWLDELEDYVQEVLRIRASRDVNALEEAHTTIGQRAADALAAMAGSWTFILTFLGLIVVWMALNAFAAIKHWDPYPFILLNLVLSCVAAVQAPIILMSQNREETRDRVRALADYEVNLKAEVLLEHLTQEVETIKAVLAEMREEQQHLERLDR